MDSILSATSILDEKNWLFFKLYKDPSTSTDWKTNLNWYHEVLINVVKPVVLNTRQVRVVFFGFYGPERYNVEQNEKYKKRILHPPARDLVYVRLRLSVMKGSKNRTYNALEALIIINRHLVWDYETMITFHVSHDLGSRYGSNTNGQTLQFIRYWDAACRFILSTLILPGNWKRDVDIWGIPHLVNNSLGCWLRPERGPVICSICQSHMYMATNYELNQPITTQTSKFPVVLFACPNCSDQQLMAHNI